MKSDPNFDYSAQKPDSIETVGLFLLPHKTRLCHSCIKWLATYMII